MNKLTYLSELGPIPDFGYELTLFHGFVSCLTPREATRAIDLTFEQQYRKRAAILRKIIRDIHVEFSACHADFVNSLLNALPTLRSDRRQSCSYLLSELYLVVPSATQTKILSSFLKSPYVSMRRRGYNILRRKWNKKFAPHLERAWRSYHEPEATRLILAEFSTEFLVNNFGSVHQCVDTNWDRRKFYLRVVPHAPKALRRLRTEDEISYVYIAAKLKLRISPREALKIFDRHMGDEDAGLLIWCFGQLGLWRTLQNIHGRLNEIMEAQSARITSKWGRNEQLVGPECAERISKPVSAGEG